jgi:RNA polymerase sigma-70 factor (TIGR02943 family)
MSIAKGNITDWVEKYTDELVSWAYYKTKQQALAEDIVQDTFIAAYNNIGKFQSKSSPKTWLFSILKNKIADHFRNKLQQSMVHESDMQSESSSNILDRLFDNTGSWVTASRPSSWDTPEEELLDNQEFNKVLKACMDLLNEKSYLSLHTIPERKGRPGNLSGTRNHPSNFWQILHRAKLQLRECIDQNWFN